MNHDQAGPNEIMCILIMWLYFSCIAKFRVLKCNRSCSGFRVVICWMLSLANYICHYGVSGSRATLLKLMKAS
ncbi:hypothetical protein JB92DRAFT_2926332 [Gautieria morchelliformis]|nr:hypothetical protein JB92DRAFT_2926332 [Gautieria morchelliformis]